MLSLLSIAALVFVLVLMIDRAACRYPAESPLFLSLCCFGIVIGGGVLILLGGVYASAMLAIPLAIAPTRRAMYSVVMVISWSELNGLSYRNQYERRSVPSSLVRNLIALRDGVNLSDVSDYEEEQYRLLTRKIGLQALQLCIQSRIEASTPMVHAIYQWQVSFGTSEESLNLVCGKDEYSDTLSALQAGSKAILDYLSCN